MSNEQKAVPRQESYGGYDYTFITEVPDDYYCSICSKVTMLHGWAGH